MTDAFDDGAASNAGIGGWNTSQVKSVDQTFDVA